MPLGRGHLTALAVIFVASMARLAGIVITTVTDLNTYTQADAIQFAATAEYIADGLARGSYVLPPDVSSTYHVWGTFLSPFWLLPGPSRIYARIGMAFLGALAVYNVYVIARHYYSKRAGLIAILPLAIYPSILFIHASILREAMVLFCLTSIARLLLAPNPELGTIQKYAFVAILLAVVTQLREDNLPVYLLVLSVAAVLAVRPWRRYPETTRTVAGVGSVFGLIGVLTYGNRIMDDLADLRENRARGRTEYLGSVLPETLLEGLAFSWIGALYFLFSPFPWMVTQLMDFVALAEGVVNLLYATAAIFGARVLATKTLAGAVALVVGIVLGSVLYGFGTANVGTAVRHRPMILWAIFLLGGIGLAHYVDWRPITDR